MFFFFFWLVVHRSKANGIPLMLISCLLESNVRVVPISVFSTFFERRVRAKVQARTFPSYVNRNLFPKLTFNFSFSKLLFNLFSFIAFLCVIFVFFNYAQFASFIDLHIRFNPKACSQSCCGFLACFKKKKMKKINISKIRSMENLNKMTKKKIKQKNN